MGLLRDIIKIAQDLSLRSNQVAQESLSPMGQYDYDPVDITIQEHRADRRGKHYDLRIVTPEGRALSFVIPNKNLNFKPGKTGAWIRMPDHAADYATWQGTIPRGEYGAGKVKIVSRYRGYLNTMPNGNQELNYTDGKNFYKLNMMGKNDDPSMFFTVARTLPSQRYWQERREFKKFPVDGDMSSGWMASEKLDGTLVYATLTEKGITLTTRRKSKRTGQPMARENHIPWVRDTRIPKELIGTVLAGEIVHPAGFMNLTPLMNSKPEHSVARQREIGKSYFYPHDIISVQGMSYSSKVPILREIVKKLNNPYIKLPRFSYAPNELLKQVQEEGGEGIILARPDAVDDTLYKYKLWDTHVGEIIDFVPGKGKYSDTMGSMVVRGADGNIVHIGGGEGLDDSLRREISRNWPAYVGKKIRIKDFGTTGSSLRQPRFDGFALEEDELDAFGE